MVHQQVNRSVCLHQLGPISLALEHKVLIKSNDFLLSCSPLDWGGLSSECGILSPFALCSVRFQSTTVIFKCVLPQLRIGSALFTATQHVQKRTDTRETKVSKLHCDASSFILFLLLPLFHAGQDHLIILVTRKWITAHVLESTIQGHTWTTHPTRSL